MRKLTLDQKEDRVERGVTGVILAGIMALFSVLFWSLGLLNLEAFITVEAMNVFLCLSGLIIALRHIGGPGPHT